MYNAQGELKCDGAAAPRKSAVEYFWQSSADVSPALPSSTKGDDIESFWQQTTLQTLDALKNIKAPHKTRTLRGTAATSSPPPEPFCNGSTCTAFH